MSVRTSSIRLSSFSPDEAVCNRSVQMIIDHYVSISIFLFLLGDFSDLIVLVVLNSEEKLFKDVSVTVHKLGLQ